ncbi:hypothetical protein CYMTET_42309 [Cymbomonas tetramitiformis]|uniref:EF-hand domain-containing protein n=1 Tax=Cymbomonas tetramitiformis TaxID=36881 RepID=A0AAE0C6I0_9CHLO|nr:hypothetical protein CYMTET_42309 [Cymbomonas tetramitiformis]
MNPTKRSSSVGRLRDHVHSARNQRDDDDDSLERRKNHNVLVTSRNVQLFQTNRSLQTQSYGRVFHAFNPKEHSNQSVRSPFARPASAMNPAKTSKSAPNLLSVSVSGRQPRVSTSLASPRDESSSPRRRRSSTPNFPTPHSAPGRMPTSKGLSQPTDLQSARRAPNRPQSSAPHGQRTSLSLTTQNLGQQHLELSTVMASQNLSQQTPTQTSSPDACHSREGFRPASRRISTPALLSSSEQKREPPTRTIANFPTPPKMAAPEKRQTFSAARIRNAVQKGNASTRPRLASSYDAGSHAIKSLKPSFKVVKTVDAFEIVKHMEKAAGKRYMERGLAPWSAERKAMEASKSLQMMVCGSVFAAIKRHVDEKALLAFEDMLKIVYPKASRSETRAMAAAVQPKKEASLPVRDLELEEDEDLNLMWSRWDPEDYGEIECDTFKEVLVELSIVKDDEDAVQKLYAQVDKDGNGYISKDEFKRWWRAL